VHERYRQTDRRTDDDSEHEHEFTFAKNLDRFFFHFVTIHAFVRQTDRNSLDRVYIACSAATNHLFVTYLFSRCDGHLSVTTDNKLFCN